MSALLELRRALGPRPLFSVGAGVCLLDHANRLLLQRRSDNGQWGIPGGSSELGEAMLDTARRELREETGIILPAAAFERVALLSGPEYYYRYPNGDEVYYVGGIYLARLPHGFALPEHTDAETLQLAFFDLTALPQTLSGPVELAAVRSVRQHLRLPASPAPVITREPPDAGPGYLQMLRAAVGSRPVFSVGAAVVVHDEHGRILLQRRSDSGRWGLPGGSSELGERLADTALRELKEETGIEARDLRFVELLMGPGYHYRYPNGDEIHNVSAVFHTRVPSSQALQTASTVTGPGETLELRFFGPAELPNDIAGPVTREALILAQSLASTSATA